jgi:hypothetical protein
VESAVEGRTWMIVRTLYASSHVAQQQQLHGSFCALTPLMPTARMMAPSPIATRFKAMMETTFVSTRVTSIIRRTICAQQPAVVSLQ